MQFQIETEKPNAVAFSIPVQDVAASPAKVHDIKERLEKRLHGSGPEELNIKEVEQRLDKARQIRETRI